MNDPDDCKTDLNDHIPRPDPDEMTPMKTDPDEKHSTSITLFTQIINLLSEEVNARITVLRYRNSGWFQARTYLKPA